MSQFANVLSQGKNTTFARYVNDTLGGENNGNYADFIDGFLAAGWARSWWEAVRSSWRAEHDHRMPMNMAIACPWT